MSTFFENDELAELRLKFIQSAQERVESIEILILKAEGQKTQEANKGVLKEIYSLSHTIKGSARVYKFEGIAFICHKIEDYISELLNHQKIVSAEELTYLLKHVDLLGSYFKEFIEFKKVDDKKYQEIYTKQFIAPLAHSDTGTKVALSNIKIQILIVGINKTILKQVYMALGDLNYKISFAADALEAFDRLALEKFDLIISSYIMNPIDGLSFSLAVKNQWRDRVPKILLLASEPIQIPYDKSIAPDHVFIKSLNLPQEMKTYLEKEYSLFKKNAPPPVPKKARNKVKSIYFVEDDPNILELFLMVFSTKKDVVLFNEVTTSDPYNRLIQMAPDLIICDIHVPNVDILSLLLKIKTSEELSKTPVVIFTGDPDQPMAAKLLKVGALAVLDKTIILTSMFEELEKVGIDLQN
jgi:CheY-like chemotaxis protein/HPt (histidine-containing phosphotransfer) domain-containing protein